MSQLLPSRRMGSRSRTRRDGERPREGHELRTLCGAAHGQPVTRHIENVREGEDDSDVADHHTNDAGDRRWFPWKYKGNPGWWIFGVVAALVVLAILTYVLVTKLRKNPHSYQHAWLSTVSLDQDTVVIKTQTSVSRENDTSRKFCS